MSHLLTSLVDRTLGLAPIVEPVRLPVFGVESNEQRNMVEHKSAEYRYGDIVTGTSVTQAADRQQSTASADTSSHHVEQKDNSVEPPANQVLNEPPAVDEITPLGQNTEAEKPGQDDDPPISPILPGHRPALTDSLASEHEPPVKKDMAPSTDSAPTVGNQESYPGDAVTEKSAFSNPGTVTAVKPALRPQEFATQSIRVPGMTNQLPLNNNSPHTQQPSIKVTIGRIEVRAVTSPPVPSPRKRKKAQPSLSLDDYLLQRTKGRR